MGDGASALAPSTTPDSSMPPYNSGAADVLGTPAQGPLAPSAAAPQDQLQPQSVQDQGQSPNFQTTPASQDPEMTIAADHHNRIIQTLATAAHAISNTLGGSETYKVTKDANGMPQIKQVESSEGEKWARIAVGILGGAAKGFAAGQGPGGAARAVGAGFDQGQQARQAQQQAAEHDVDEQQKIMTRNANNALLNQQIVRQTWDNSHLSRDDQQRQEDIALDHATKLSDSGFIPLAMNVKDSATLAKYGAANPLAVGAHMGANGDMIYNEPDGNGGVNFYHLPADSSNQPIAEPYKAEMISVDPEDRTKTISKPFSIPAGTKKGTLATQLMALNVANDNALRSASQNAKDQQGNIPKTLPEMQLALQKATDPQEKAQLQAAINAQLNTPETKARIAQQQAETAKAWAEKNEADFKIGKGPTGSALVDAIASGHVTVDRLGYLLARNPDLIAAVQAKDPSFDSAKAAQYPATYKEFTSSKPGTAGAALNNGATALKHLRELNDMNTAASHIPHTTAYTNYMNKVDTVASELAKFYGNSTIPAIEGIKQTLTTTLPGNRHGAIMTQAQSMGDKLDSYEQTWNNAAPSAAYEAPMPQIDQKAKDARAALDPNYKARLVQEQQGTPAPKPTPAPAPAPGAFTAAPKQPPNPPYPGAVFGTGANGPGWYPGGGR